MSTDLPVWPSLRLQEAVARWKENTPAVANAIPQRHKSHVKAGEFTYLLPPPAREFADFPELDPKRIAMREVAAAEKECGFEVDVLRPDPVAAAAMYEFDCKLSEAAFDQRVQFMGKQDTFDTSDHKPIPSGYFSTQRGFCFGSEIEPFPYPINDEALFKDAFFKDEISGKVAVWHDVLVHRDKFISWLTEAYPSCADRIPRPIRKALRSGRLLLRSVYRKPSRRFFGAAARPALTSHGRHFAVKCAANATEWPKTAL